MKVVMAKKFGFCMGVKRAIEIVNKVAEGGHGATVLHQIVHNPSVSVELKKKGIAEVEEMENVETKTVIFSAHGVAPSVKTESERRGLEIVDATCPLVLKVHGIVKSFAIRGYEFIYVGHRGHPEPLGVMGEALGKVRLIERKEEIDGLSILDPERLVIVTQTTLSVSDTAEIMSLLSKKFPKAKVFNTICLETTERQKALLEILPEVEVVIVVGGKNSSNSQRLVDLAREAEKPSYLVETFRDLNSEWFSGISCVGLSAGASTPDFETFKVKETIERM